MPFEYNYSQDKQILEIATSGVVETSSWPSIIRDSLEEGRKYSCTRYLFDQREAKIHVNLGQLFGMPRNAGEFKQPLNARIAILLRKVVPVQKEFIESFNRDRGFNVKVFDNKGLAVSWLEENVSPPTVIIGP
jgi:hypothetical protein